VRAHSWWKILGEGELDITALAQREGISDSYITRVLRAAFLSPAVTEAILDGRQHAAMVAGDLRSKDIIPVHWDAQARLFLPAVPLRIGKPSRCKRDALPTELRAPCSGNQGSSGFLGGVNQCSCGTVRKQVDMGRQVIPIVFPQWPPCPAAANMTRQLGDRLGPRCVRNSMRSSVPGRTGAQLLRSE
jgi:hypothetical protein